jgi:hypothetical protein
MRVVHRWDYTWRQKTEVEHADKNFPQCHCAHHKSHECYRKERSQYQSIYVFAYVTMASHGLSAVIRKHVSHQQRKYLL